MRLDAPPEIRTIATSLPRRPALTSAIFAAAANECASGTGWSPRMATTVGYGEAAPSELTMTPPTIEWSDRRSEATAAFAIGVAALPNAKIQTRASRLIDSASTARAVAALGDAAMTAAPYNSVTNSRSSATGPGMVLELMRSSSS